jgi:hypothetical protein
MIAVEKTRSGRNLRARTEMCFKPRSATCLVVLLGDIDSYRGRLGRGTRDRSHGWSSGVGFGSHTSILRKCDQLWLLPDWRHEYDTFRPHSALGYRPSAPEAVESQSARGARESLRPSTLSRSALSTHARGSSTATVFRASWQLRADGPRVPP